MSALVALSSSPPPRASLRKAHAMGISDWAGRRVRFRHGMRVDKVDGVSKLRSTGCRISKKTIQRCDPSTWMSCGKVAVSCQRAGTEGRQPMRVVCERYGRMRGLLCEDSPARPMH